jgi:hypothetical protein
MNLLDWIANRLNRRHPPPTGPRVDPLLEGKVNRLAAEVRVLDLELKNHYKDREAHGQHGNAAPT